MNSLACVVMLLLLGPQKIGDVESSFDKKANFGTFRTYAWNKGQEAFDPSSHRIIVDAIDSQMAGLGFTKAEPNAADVILKYHTVRGTDVDLKALEKAQKPGQTEPLATKMLGKLVVVLYPRGSTTPLWQANTRSHLSEDAATRVQEIQRAVASLFDTYPGRKGQR